MLKKIVILTAVHPYKVSGRSITDLKNLLKDKGHEVVVVTNSYLREELEDVISVKSLFSVLKIKVFTKIISLITKQKRKDSNFYMFDQNSHKIKFDTSIILKKIPFKPDAFIYLFQQGFLNEEALYQLNKSTGAPIYRYMVDMAEMTGGCHYAWDCEGYLKSCGSCPGLSSDNPKDQTYYNLKFKKKFIDSSQIYPIAASEWQMQQLLKSTLYRNIKKHKILFPIDENTFYSQDKKATRVALKLPSDKKIIFFGAVNTTEKRKGAKELLEALNYLNTLLPAEKRDQIHLVIAGKADNTFTDQLLFTSSCLGYLEYKDLAKAYSAADVFICPSIEDSGPTMINQSLMCGTPVVSFKMGVALDLVIDYKTGYKAELGNSVDLAKGIRDILELDLRDKCLVWSRAIIGREKIYEDLSKMLSIPNKE